MTLPQTHDRSTLVHEREQEWREAAAAENAAEAARVERPTVRHRLLMLVPPAVVAGGAPLALGWTPGFSTANTTTMIIASAIVALAAVAIVPLAHRLGASLRASGAGDRLLFAAALASAGAAAIHFSVIKANVEQYALYGLFFVAAGIAQLVWPIWLMLRRWPPLLVLGAIGNAAIVALWIVDRVGLMPIGPDAKETPTVGLGDSLASGFELLIVVVCIVALAHGRSRPLHRRAKLALTLGTVALTALAFLSVFGVGSSILPPSG